MICASAGSPPPPVAPAGSPRKGDDRGEDGHCQAEQRQDYQEAIEGAGRRQIPRVITLWTHESKRMGSFQTPIGQIGPKRHGQPSR